MYTLSFSKLKKMDEAHQQVVAASNASSLKLQVGFCLKGRELLVVDENF